MRLTTSKEPSSQEDLYIVSGGCIPLLSFSAASRLVLVHITHSVKEVTHRLDPKRGLPRRLQKRESLKGFHVHLHVDLLVQPVAQPHRRIRFSVRKSLEEELERLQSLDIIKDWLINQLGTVNYRQVLKPNNMTQIIFQCALTCAVPTKPCNVRDMLHQQCITSLLHWMALSHFQARPKRRISPTRIWRFDPFIPTLSAHAGLFQYKRHNFEIITAAVFQDTIRQVLASNPTWST